MKINLELDEDALDRLVCCALKDSMGCSKYSIKKLKMEKNLQSSRKEDLANEILILDALERVYNYFGGNRIRKN